VELRNVTLDDLELYHRLYCDPRMMSELGGPLPHDGLADKLRRDVDSTDQDLYWMLVVVPDGDGASPAGTVCVWEHLEGEETINEIGWMVLPEYQGRGFGGAAVRSLLQRARHASRWDIVDAFPGVTNGASNAICRKLGFSKIGERDIDYAGRMLRCNRWRLDVRTADLD
jgi:RimJ/RimL family protein N-acetyltransferase